MARSSKISKGQPRERGQSASMREATEGRKTGAELGNMLLGERGGQRSSRTRIREVSGQKGRLWGTSCSVHTSIMYQSTHFFRNFCNIFKV